MWIHKWDLWYICGGQLAAMGVEAARKEWLTPVVLCTSEVESAVQAIREWGGTSVISNKWATMQEKYTNQTKLDEFIAALKPWAPVAFDWENAPVEALKYLESKGLLLKPSHQILSITQHRGTEKAEINKIHWSTVTANYHEVRNFVEGQKAFREFWAWRFKTSTGGYDWKWQWTINSEEEIEEVFKEFWENIPDLVYEQNVSFKEEVSIIVWRNARWQTVAYDPFINTHGWGILWNTLVWDSWIDKEVDDAMIEFTKKTAEWLWLEWIMALEFFLLKDGNFKANEIAARAHNSGHITMDSHDISQFDLQILTMMNETLPTPQLLRNGYMQNVIGPCIYNHPGVLNWWKYGKRKSLGSTYYSYWKEMKKGRKMWHINKLRD